MGMDPERAAELAFRLGLAYPGRQIDEGHFASWAEELARYGEDVAAETVERLRENFASPPSAADVLDELRDVQATLRPALPEADGTLWAPEPVPMPEEVREAIDEMQSAWAEDEKRSRAEEAAEWEQKKLAAMTGPKLRSPCARVVGQPTVAEKGHVYCPSCGEDLCVDCPPGLRREDVGA